MIDMLAASLWMWNMLARLDMEEECKLNDNCNLFAFEKACLYISIYV